MSTFRKICILFKTTFLISLTTNTGYAILSAMKANFIRKYHWFTEEEMADYIAMAQSAPGPMAVNASLIIGWQTAGAAGSAAAAAGCALPPCLISFVLLMVYRKYKKLSFMRNFLEVFKCMAIALIFSTFLRITGRIFEFGNVKRDLPGCVLIVFSFLVLRKYKINPLYITVGCEYCYARNNVRRWHMIDDYATPEFFPDKLRLMNKQKPQNFLLTGMSDLSG